MGLNIMDKFFVTPVVDVQFSIVRHYARLLANLSKLLADDDNAKLRFMNFQTYCEI